MQMSNKAYDVLKWIALIVVPAAIALCSGLTDIWDWSCGEQIVATLSLVEIFLGAILQISNSKYKKTNA